MLTFHYREMTADQGLWLSIPHEAPDGIQGAQHIRQGVIGGFTGSPRCAIADNGYFYGLGHHGREISLLEAQTLGLVEDRAQGVLPGTLCNADLVREIRFCGYSPYDTAIKACDSALPVQIGKSEAHLLEKLQSWDGRVIPFISKVLLFGALTQGLSKTELASLVKLTRREAIRFYRTFHQGAHVLMIQFPARLT